MRHGRAAQDESLIGGGVMRLPADEGAVAALLFVGNMGFFGAATGSGAGSSPSVR